MHKSEADVQESQTSKNLFSLTYLAVYKNSKGMVRDKPNWVPIIDIFNFHLLKSCKKLCILEIIDLKYEQVQVGI